MSLKLRSIIAGLIMLGVIIKVAPNFIDTNRVWWPAAGKITYGLDIQGGAHLVMGVDTETVMNQKLVRTARSLTTELKEAQVSVKGIEVTDTKNFVLTVELENSSDETKTRELVEKNYKNFLQVVQINGNKLNLKVFETQVSEMRKQVLDQAIGVIRNRIDEFGVAEPTIQAQGDNRILVQLPGVQDSAHAKELINRTARLEFRIVSREMGSDQMTKLDEMIKSAEEKGGFNLSKDGISYAQYLKKLNEALKGQIPANTMVAFEKSPMAKTLEAGKIPYLLKTDTNIGGELLDDAFVSYDERGSPQVAFRFGIEGARLFGQLTESNIGQLLAIVLDDVVQSAPVIQSKISESGVINLNRGNMEETFKEAKFITTTLRAGALPATLEQLEERTVGPTLGADSIQKAKVAGYVVLAVIWIFMTLYYGGMGFISGIGLFLNVVCLLAVMTSLGATLTLPGIAGMILTMGMAIDSNVIIFERILEEFKKGSAWKLAVQDGFGNAYSAIIDSNLVGAGVALILYYYGTGPVRGFAVTLLGGTVTSMFTAVYLSKILIEAAGPRLAATRKIEKATSVTKGASV